MFEYPYVAGLFVTIPIFGLLYFFRFKDRQTQWAVFQSKNRWATSIRLSHTETYLWQKIMTLLGMVFIIFSLMKPQFGDEYQTVQRDGRQLFFVVDTSLSMLAEDGAKTRLDLAKYHIQQLLPKLNDDTISILPYANTAYTFLPLTSDLGAVDMFLEDLYVGMIGSSGSDIMNALGVAKDTIKKTGAPATIVIFSDGEFTPSIDQDRIQAMFRGLEISSVVVGLGSLQGEPIPLRDDQGKIVMYKKDDNNNIVITKRMDNQLERLAESLGGIIIEGDISPLVAEKVYLHLSDIETTTLKQKQQVKKIDRYHSFLFVALLLLMGSSMLPRLQLVWKKLK